MQGWEWGLEGQGLKQKGVKTCVCGGNQLRSGSEATFIALSVSYLG